MILPIALHALVEQSLALGVGMARIQSQAGPGITGRCVVAARPCPQRGSIGQRVGSGTGVLGLLGDRACIAGQCLLRLSGLGQGDTEVVVSGCEVRPRGDRPAIAGNGRGEVALAGLQSTQAVVCLGVIGRQCNRAAVVGPCQLALAACGVQCSTVAIGIGVARFDLDGAIEAALSLIELAQLPQRQRAGVVCRRMGRLPGQHAIEGLQSLHVLLLLLPTDAQIGGRAGAVGIQNQGLLEALDRFGRSTELALGDAQADPGGGVGWRHRCQPPIELMRIGQAPRGPVEISQRFEGSEVLALKRDLARQPVGGIAMSPQAAVRRSQVLTGQGHLGLDIQGLLDHSRGGGVVAGLQRRHAEKVQGVEMSGLRFEHRLIAGRGFGQAAGLMLGIGLLKAQGQDRITRHVSRAGSISPESRQVIPGRAGKAPRTGSFRRPRTCASHRVAKGGIQPAGNRADCGVRTGHWTAAGAARR